MFIQYTPLLNLFSQHNRFIFEKKRCTDLRRDFLQQRLSDNFTTGTILADQCRNPDIGIYHDIHLIMISYVMLKCNIF